MEGFITKNAYSLFRKDIISKTSFLFRDKVMRIKQVCVRSDEAPSRLSASDMMHRAA